MKIENLRELLLDRYKEDSWWVAINGDVQDEPMDFMQLSNVWKLNGHDRISVLHTEDAADESWIHLDKASGKEEAPVNKARPKKKSLTLHPFGSSASASPRIALSRKKISLKPEQEEVEAPQISVPNIAPPQQSHQSTESVDVGVSEPVPSSIDEAPSAAGVDNADYELLLERCNHLEKEMAILRKEFSDAMKELKEARDLLDEREEFITASEERLMEKVHEQEVRTVELEHQEDELRNAS